jgi:hypothetical protein
MTRTKNRVHAVLHANLIPPFMGKLFMAPGRKWLAEQPLEEHEGAAVNPWLAGWTPWRGSCRQHRPASATTVFGG